MQGRGPSNEMCLMLQPKKTKVGVSLAVTKAAKGILYNYVLYITNKMEHGP